MENRIHELKTWPEYYDALISGEKTFEIRRNDREYHVGDTLELLKFEPERGFLGQWSIWEITYILDGGKFGIESGYVVMAVKLLRVVR